MPLRARHILLVDDQPSIRGVLQRALADAGARVSIAPDGASAVQRAQEARPDVIVLDLAMPGMDGWEVLAALRQAGATAIPVILQTADRDFSSFQRARREGVAAFVSKPFRLDQVVETCRRIVNGARPLQGIAEPEPEKPLVHVHDASGNLLAIGHVLELAGRGGRLDLEIPLSRGQRVHITLPTGDSPLLRAAEVRWANKVDGRFHHGIALYA